MYAKSNRLDRVVLNFAAGLSFFLGGGSFAQDDNAFRYFGREGIDYWNDKKTNETAPHVVRPETKADETFPWKKYLDPKNKEFFREGDYTPPEPFMEIVRNPSDENLRLWFQYIERKNELSARLQSRMSEYLGGTKAAALPLEAKAELQAKAREVMVGSQAAVDAKRYRFRMYFDSSCPHCRRMFGTLGDLAARGFFVEARQIDSRPIENLRPTVPVERATESDVKSRAITSVPLLLVGDLERKLVYRITGYKSTAEIMQALRTGELAPASGGPPP